MKKIIILAIVLISMLVLPLNVFAENSIGFSFGEETNASTEIIHVTGKLDGVGNNRYVTIAVLESGKELDNLLSEDEDAKYIGVAAVAYDGSFEYKFKFTDEGDYTIYAVYEDSLESLPFTYVIWSDVTTFFSNIASGTISGTALYDKLDSYAVALGLDLAPVKNTRDKKLVAQRIVEKKADVGSNGEVAIKTITSDAIKEINLLNDLKNASHWSQVEGILSELSAITNVSFNYRGFSHQDIDGDIMGIEYDNAEAVADEISSLTKGGGSGSSGSSGGSGGSRLPSGGSWSYGSELSVIKQPNSDVAMFSDLANVQWAQDYIMKLAEKGIVNGAGNNCFLPNDNVKREEFVKILVMAFGILDENSYCEFSDVSTDDWFYKYVASAYNKGIITGMDDGSFGIGENITRQDMSVMLYRCINNPSITSSENVMFDDYEDIADYAKDSVLFLAKKGIISGMGNGKFEPNEPATRAQAAVMVAKMLEGESN